MFGVYQKRIEKGPLCFGRKTRGKKKTKAVKEPYDSETKMKMNTRKIKITTSDSPTNTISHHPFHNTPYKNLFRTQYSVLCTHYTHFRFIRLVLVFLLLLLISIVLTLIHKSNTHIAFIWIFSFKKKL